jgi:aspartate/methionine/tyrosine aminotransferase
MQLVSELHARYIMMREKLSQAVKAIPPSVIGRPSYRFHDSQDMISMGIGEPDFTTHEEIYRAALNDARDGHTHYTSSRGDPELLEELAVYIKGRYGVTLNPENLLITAGGMGGLIAFFRTVLDPGDEVLVPEPYFAVYGRNIEFAGGTMVPIPSHFEDGYALKIEAVERAISPRSKVLLLNSPNNPTGAVIPGSTLMELARLAREKDLLVLSDEVYNRFIFDGQTHESIYTQPGMAERTCVIDSFSKSFAMTGWRLGWAFGPEWLMSPMRMVAGYSTISASSVSQRAALAALRLDPTVVDTMVKEFGSRVDLVYQSLQSMPRIRVHKPAGTFYIFPNIGEITSDSREFASRLLERAQVVVFPGAAFGPSGQSSLRLACTISKPMIEQAMERLSRFISDYTE